MIFAISQDHNRVNFTSDTGATTAIIMITARPIQNGRFISKIVIIIELNNPGAGLPTAEFVTWELLDDQSSSASSYYLFIGHVTRNFLPETMVGLAMQECHPIYSGLL